MSRSTKRSITSIRYPGWILLQTEAMPLGRSLISSNAQRWSRSPMFIKELKSLYGRLLVMIKKMKCFQIGTYSPKGVLLRWRNWMSRKIYYLSEEMYNIYKEDLMPNKKKKNKKNNKKKKIKKKKAKAKKRKNKR